MVTNGRPARKRTIIYISVGGLAVATCCVPALLPGTPEDPPPEPVPTPSSSAPEPPRCEYTVPKAERRARQARIVGGHPAQEGAWPFAVALATLNNTTFCTGSLVAPDRVLTAAHCQVQPGELVLAGSTDLKKAKRIEVTRTKIHPAFEPWTQDLDVSILDLAAPVQGIEPVGVSETPNEFAADAIVIGWGATYEGGGMVQHLREVDVPRWSWDDCREAYSTLTPNQTCSGMMGKDSCQGDSGGPLLVFTPAGWEQIGITAYGRGCAREGYPGVYTATFSKKVREWITICTID